MSQIGKAIFTTTQPEFVELERFTDETLSVFTSKISNGEYQLGANSSAILNERREVVGRVMSSLKLVGTLNATAVYDTTNIGGYFVLNSDGDKLPLKEHLSRANSPRIYELMARAVNNIVDATLIHAEDDDEDNILFQLLLLKLLIAVRWGTGHWGKSDQVLNTDAINNIFANIRDEIGDSNWKDSLDIDYPYSDNANLLDRYNLPYFNLIDDYFTTKATPGLKFSATALEVLLANRDMGVLVNTIFFEDKFMIPKHEPKIDISGSDLICPEPETK